MRRVMLCMFLLWIGSLSHSIQGAEPLCHDLIQALGKEDKTEVNRSVTTYIQSRLSLEAIQIDERKKAAGFVSWFDLLSYGVLEQFFVHALSKSLQEAKTSPPSSDEIDQKYQTVKQEMLDRLRRELQAQESEWSAPEGEEERQRFDIFYWRLCEALTKMPDNFRIPFLFRHSDALLAEIGARIHAPARIAQQEAWWKCPDSKPYLWEVMHLEEMEEMQKVIRPFLQECTEKVCITWEDTGRKSLVTIDGLLQLPNERIHSAQGNLLPCTVWSQLFDDVTGENWTLSNTTKYMQHLQILKGMTQAHDAACSTCQKVDFGDSFLWLEMSYLQFLDELKKGNAPPPSPAESFHSSQEEWGEEWDLCGVIESLM